MNLQVLVSTMHQTDHSLLEKMNIQSDVIVINQCDRNEFEKFEYNDNVTCFLSLAERGVGLSRNNALMRATADICLFADDDVTYVNGYKDIIIGEFIKNPKADVIVFNVPSINSERGTSIITRRKRIRFYNCLKYGTYQISIKTESIQKANIYFSLLFGGGAKFSSGEDSMFILDCIKRGLKVYASAQSIGTVAQVESTWFKGYTDKYFIDKGALYACLTNRWSKLLCLQFCLRHRKMFKKEKTWKQAFRLMVKGIKNNKRMKMMKSTISIVVPVYKVEKYLDKCMQSLVNQTYRKIEIILVDDGSPDNCPSMCDQYAKEDLRIKVIHKENGGLSDARNAGIQQAIGKYILFVDSDDYIDLDTCERFVEVIGSNNPDIIIGNARVIKGKKISNMQHQFNTYGEMVTGKQYLKEELKTCTMYMAAWLNLYNRVFLSDNQLQFKVDLLHEDEQFTPRAFLKAKKVIGTEIIFYNYLIREGSITTTKNKIKNAEHLIKTCKELEGIYDKLEDNELRMLLNDNLVNKYLNIFQVAGLYKKQCAYLVDKAFLKGKAFTKRNKLRVALFCLSKKGYYYVNRMTKYLKRSI